MTSARPEFMNRSLAESGFLGARALYINADLGISLSRDSRCFMNMLCRSCTLLRKLLLLCGSRVWPNCGCPNVFFFLNDLSVVASTESATAMGY